MINLRGLYENDKFGTKISLFATHFLSLLQNLQKYLFSRNFYEHIEYGDIHLDIFPKHFVIFKFISR
jgi:hypothetical protein